MYKIVKVAPYKRKGKDVLGYKRKQLEKRGDFIDKKKYPQVTRTTFLKDTRGLFKGRKRVEGRGDLTGIFREKKGRIIGRTLSPIRKEKG